MRRILQVILIISFLVIPVSAMDITAPEAPESAQEYMPDETETFAEGLWYIIKTAIAKLHPSIAQAMEICFSLIAIVLLVSLLQSFSDSAKKATQLAGALTISILLMQPVNTFIHFGSDTITTLSNYGKLLLPVLTTALAAQGGTTSSATLYAGTALFNSVLSTIIANIMIPLLYIYLCLCIANSIVGESLLKNLQSFLKWGMTWLLKVVLYVFTGYISITGVVGGSVDSASVKAAKLAISGAVPVVGGILSDASEAILVSAGLMKNAVGIYGLLAIVAVWIGPFLQIGIQYLLLKMTAAICSVIGNNEATSLIGNFSAAMGILLAMTSTVCILLLISTVCFMKGVS